MHSHPISDNVDYTVRNVSFIKYKPQIKSLQITDRKQTSVLHVIHGKYHYASRDADFIAEDGDTVYLPTGASYRYVVLSENTDVMQVVFTFEMLVDEEKRNADFLSQPFLLKKDSNSLNILFNSLNHFQNDSFFVLSTVYRLLYEFKKAGSRNANSIDRQYKIDPALDYIARNFKNPIKVSDIADVCDISESHLRRLFHARLGISPIEYKNRLLIKAACQMLQCDNVNVTETANALNFNDIYTFSQFFKRMAGISPRHYKEKYMNAR